MSEKIKKEIIEWIKVIILAAAITFAITSFVKRIVHLLDKYPNVFGKIEIEQKGAKM